MELGKLQKISITRKQIRAVYDQGPEAVEDLVLSLVDSINQLIDISEKQEKRIKRLEAQINKNSRNSSKPPSSDSPFKNKDKKKKKQSTGVKKKRKGTTLKQVEDPDAVVKCKVDFCEHCQSDLSAVNIQTLDKRQVTDLPPIKAYTIEYQGEVKECPNCHKITKAIFPLGVTHKIQYGSGIQAVAVYLRNYQLIPLERTIELFKDLFNISLSEGTIVNMTTRCADNLSGFMEIVKQKWASKMINIIFDIKEKVDLSEENILKEDLISEFIKKYDKIIKQGYKANPPPKKTGKRGRPKKGKVLCLIGRMDSHREEILRFMKEKDVPFDNNLAERDLRMVKVRQKISGTFRNINRVEDYCRIRSYISTMKKQKKDVFTALVDSFKPYFAERPVIL